MRKVIVGALAVLALSFSARADVTRTTTTTTYSGTVSEMSPGSSTIVLRSDKPEVTKYIYNDKTLWVDSAGNTVRMDTVQNQPVTVYYEKQGDQLVVTRVVTQKSEPAKIIEQRTTTTREIQ